MAQIKVTETTNAEVIHRAVVDEIWRIIADIPDVVRNVEGRPYKWKAVDGVNRSVITYGDASFLKNQKCSRIVVYETSVELQHRETEEGSPSDTSETLLHFADPRLFEKVEEWVLNTKPSATAEVTQSVQIKSQPNTQKV